MAIWYINEWNQWAIGDYQNIGTTYRGIRSGVDAACPGRVGDGNWDYQSQSNWYNAGTNIQVTCLGDTINNIHKLISHNLYVLFSL